MADDGFVLAVDPGGNKRRVPKKYLDNPALGFKLPPSTRVHEPAAPANTIITEPAKPGRTQKEVSE